MKKLIVFTMQDIMPSHEGLPGIDPVVARQFLDQFSKEGHRLLRIGLWAATWVYALTPLFTIHIPLPVFLLTKKQRELHLQRYSHSSNFIFAQLWDIQRMFAGMVWGQDEKVRAYFGYEAHEADTGDFHKGEQL